MKKLIIGITIGLIGSAAASFFNFDGRRTNIGGVDCVVVKVGDGGGVSCNWGK